jgi:peptide/nickel transport system permease protein
MADLPSDLVVAGVAPRADETAADRVAGRWRGRLGLIVPGAMVAFIFLLCFVWPIIGPVPPPTGGNILNASLPAFSPGHFLGTDPVGNDEWSRILYGGRTSLEIALAVQAIGLVLGGLIGAVAAYLGGWRDTTIMRVLDVLIAFPGLVLAVAIAQGLGPSELHTIWALCSSASPRPHGSRGRPPCASASRRSSPPHACRERASRECCSATSRRTSCPSY